MAADGDRENLLGLGSFIRTQRRLAELSQRELAKLTELSDPYVSQLERGLHEPSVRVLRAIATALNMPLETLMSHAGWIEPSDDEDGAIDTADAIRKDKKLNPKQRAALLEVYAAFTADSKGDSDK